MEGSTLGSLSVEEGVPLAPFYLNTEGIGETEPNDTCGSAQQSTVPAVIQGGIGSTSDVDCFRFTGRRGDLLSAMVEAAGLETPSDLDSELFLLGPDGTQIAWNDQSGARGSAADDSLIRMLLPADGAYCLKITDYHREGGDTYRYRLHVGIQPR
jgi:hypothetical protein